MKKIIRKIISKFSKYSSIYENSFDLIKIMNFNNIDLVLDVGASWGGYAKTLRRFGYKNKIISFEPVNESHNKLLKNSSNDDLWEVYNKVIISDKTENKTTLNVSKDLDNSSTLHATKLHRENYNDAKFTHQEEVNSEKLDNIFDKYCSNKKNVMLKIDVQGSEMNVLTGVEKNLNKFKLVQVEVSIQPMYEGQILWSEIVNFMKNKNFDIWTIYTGYKNKSIGQLYQFDVIFYNKSLRN